MTWKEPLGAAGIRAKQAHKRKRRIDERHAQSVKRMREKDERINSWRYKPRSKWTPTDIKRYNDHLARKAMED